MGKFQQGRHAFGRRFWFAPLALIAALMAGPALGQGAVKSVHKDWQIRCDTPPGAKAEQCALIQSVTAEDRPNVGLSLIVLKTADKKMRLMRVLVPLGVLLTEGLKLNIDNVEVGKTGYVRCLPNGCVAEVVLDQADEFIPHRFCFNRQLGLFPEHVGVRHAWMVLITNLQADLHDCLFSLSASCSGDVAELAMQTPMAFGHRGELSNFLSSVPPQLMVTQKAEGRQVPRSP